MSKLTYLIFILVVLLTACSDNESRKPDPQPVTTFFGDSDLLYHTGTDLVSGTSYFYQTTSEGKIVWNYILESRASISDGFHALDDGSVVIHYSTSPTRQVAKFSSSGVLLWKKTITYSVYEIFSHENELWLAGRNADGYGMVVLNEGNGESIETIVLNTIPPPQYLTAKFAYNNGALLMACPVNHGYLLLAKFNKTGELWREENNQQIPDYEPQAFIFDENGFSLFMFNMTTHTKVDFDANGRLVTSTNLQVPLPATGGIYKKKSTGYEIVIGNVDKVMWLTLNESHEVTASKEMATSFSFIRFLHYKQQENTMMLSVYCRTSSNEESVSLFKILADGTMEAM